MTDAKHHNGVLVQENGWYDVYDGYDGQAYGYMYLIRNGIEDDRYRKNAPEKASMMQTHDRRYGI